MDKYEWIKPSEQEKIKIARLILKEAHSHLKHLNNESEYPEIIKAVIRAFKTAQDLSCKYDKEFKLSNKDEDKYCHGYGIAISWVVANAYMFVMLSDVYGTDINDMHPYNPAGAAIEPFVKACQIIEKGYEYKSALACMDEEFDDLYHIDEIVKDIEPYS